MRSTAFNKREIEKIWTLAYAKGFFHGKEKPSNIGNFEDEYKKILDKKRGKSSDG